MQLKRLNSDLLLKERSKDISLKKNLIQFFVEPYKIKLFPVEYYRGCPKKKIGCMQDLTPLDG
jgi:hypothetical protein